MTPKIQYKIHINYQRVIQGFILVDKLDYMGDVEFGKKGVKTKLRKFLGIKKKYQLDIYYTPEWSGITTRATDMITVSEILSGKDHYCVDLRLTRRG